MTNNPFQIIAESSAKGEKAALCILVATKGSAPRKTGTKMVVFGDGSIKGTIGGGSLERQVINDAMQVMEYGAPRKFVYQLDNDLQMQCGGEAEVYIEPASRPHHLFIFGAGHVGGALAKYASGLGFTVTAIDPRDEPEKVLAPLGVKIIKNDYIKAAGETVFPENSYIVIATPKHEFDEEVLAIVAPKKTLYTGMIGSKNKVALARKRLIRENILSPDEADWIDMPIGIKFNAQTPEEIAISILAKLIDVKNSALG